MQPIYTAFFTAGTFYEQEANRLKRSLDRLGLEHDIRPIVDPGNWTAASRYTATHICNMLAAYPDRPVVQLDADAVVWRRPIIFDALEVDVAAHWRRGKELLNGTVYFGPTQAAKDAAERYRKLIDDHPQCTNEQTMLAKALIDIGSGLTFYDLPASYCFIPDIMAGDIGDGEIVIAHMQASRTAKRVGGEPEQNRAKWIAEWEHFAGI